MTTYAYTVDAISFATADLNGQPLTSGRLVRLPATTPEGFREFRLQDDTPLPEWGVYEMTPSPVTCEPATYYAPAPAGYTYTLSGPLGQSASIVIETRECVPIDIEELRDIKLSELELYAGERLYLSVQSKDAPNRWIVTDPRARERFGSINLILTDRAKDRALATNTGSPTPTKDPINTYCVRDPSIRLIKNATGETEIQAVSEVPWGQVVKDVGLKDETDEQAALACRTDILAAVDWNILAAIDPATYAWEPAYGD